MKQTDLEKIAADCKGKERNFLLDREYPYCMLKLKFPKAECKYLGKSYKVDLPNISGAVKECKYK